MTSAGKLRAVIDAVTVPSTCHALVTRHCAGCHDDHDDGYGDLLGFTLPYGTVVEVCVTAAPRSSPALRGTRLPADLINKQALFLGKAPFFGEGEHFRAFTPYPSGVETRLAGAAAALRALPASSSAAHGRVASARAPKAVERAVLLARRSGIALVAAAGNEQLLLDRRDDVLSLPAETRGVLAVAALGPTAGRVPAASRSAARYASGAKLRLPVARADRARSNRAR
jgi:hypothetical protein